MVITIEGLHKYATETIEQNRNSLFPNLYPSCEFFLEEVSL